MSEGSALSIALDGLIVALLVATIAYAFVLNRKLANLRATKGEMNALVARLVEATERAQTGLNGLREHAQASGAQLQQGIEAARGRADELGFLIERAEALAAKLEGPIGAVRSRPPAGDVRPAGAPGARPAVRGPAPTVHARTAAPPPETGAPEADLLKALRGLR